MSEARIAVLADRGVVAVTGEDARKLLGGIITNDIDLLDTQTALFAGLLSPQGKVLFDFIVVREGGGYWLEVAGDKAADLAKRLTMYRLRAQADIEVLGASHHVLVAWPASEMLSDDTGILPLVAYLDPRHPDLGWRAVMGPLRDHWIGAKPNSDHAEADYHAHRIALGIPEGGKDYAFGDAYPHEANFDLNNGVSFTKGCYVGQEIVARMEHRTVVRKRVVRVSARAGATLSSARPEIVMGDVVIGRLGTAAGRHGLAMLRLDRAMEAIEEGVPITAGGLALEVDPDAIARYHALSIERKGLS